jgi:alpha-beta hydrolase superfamily lysophospholipase
MVKKEEFTFDSRDGQTKIHALRWVPEGKVVCILQIVHGMAEYMERYEETAQYFAQRNILVTGEDHLGHGKSVPENGTYGYFCKQDPATVVVRDVHRLKKITQEAYPGIPYILLGHSMGSFITRNYLFRYGSGIQGAILCGTGCQNEAVLGFSRVLSGLAGLFCGQKHVAGLLDRLAFSSYNKRIAKPETKNDWLCSERQVVEAYEKDMLCGFTFTVNGFETLFTLLQRQNRMENLQNMPKDLPVLFVSGEEDPVGNYGKGVKKAYESFEKAGMKRISLKLYPGDRHELLNEKDREQVWEELLRFVEERIQEYEI